MAEGNRNTDLASLLTGEALGIPREMLDLQGREAARHAYTSATPEEQEKMEKRLAGFIKSVKDLGFVADAIHLARALKMQTPCMRDVVGEIEERLNQQLGPTYEYKERILTEIKRYYGDVQE